MMGPPRKSSRRLGPGLGKQSIGSRTTLDQPVWKNTTSVKLGKSPLDSKPQIKVNGGSTKSTKPKKETKTGDNAIVESKEYHPEPFDLDVANDAEAVNKQAISLLDADCNRGSKEDKNIAHSPASTGRSAMKGVKQRSSKQKRGTSEVNEENEGKKSAIMSVFNAVEESKGSEDLPPSKAAEAVTSPPSSGQYKYAMREFVRSAKTPAPSSSTKRPPFGRMVTTSIHDHTSPSPPKSRAEKRSEGISKRKSLTVEQLGRKLPWGNTNQPKSRTIGRPVNTREFLRKDPSTASLSGKTHRRMSQMSANLSPSGASPHKEHKGVDRVDPRPGGDIFSRLYNEAFMDPDLGHQLPHPTAQHDKVVRASMSVTTTSTTAVKSEDAEVAGDELPVQTRAEGTHEVDNSHGEDNGVSTLPSMLRAKPSASTEAAEYLRLSAWLEANGLSHLLPLLEHGGVTKLSVLELLTISDLKSVGMETDFAELITAKINEMTSQTSDVLGRLNMTASPETSLSPSHSAASGARGRERGMSGASGNGGGTHRAARTMSPPIVGKPRDHPHPYSTGSSTPKKGGIGSGSHTLSSLGLGSPLQRSGQPQAAQFSSTERSVLSNAIVKAFDSGDGDLFLFPWRVAVSLMPADTRFGTLSRSNNEQDVTNAAVSYVARLGLEFSLYVYFLVAALEAEAASEDSEKDSEAAHSHTQRRRSHLREFLKSISITSPGSVAAQAVATLKSSKDYRLAEGLEDCVDPLSQPLYSDLFASSWKKKLRARLELFLSLMGLSLRNKDKGYQPQLRTPQASGPSMVSSPRTRGAFTPTDRHKRNKDTKQNTIVTSPGDVLRPATTTPRLRVRSASPGFEEAVTSDQGVVVDHYGVHRMISPVRETAKAQRESQTNSRSEVMGSHSAGERFAPHNGGTPDFGDLRHCDRDGLLKKQVQSYNDMLRQKLEQEEIEKARAFVEEEYAKEGRDWEAHRSHAALVMREQIALESEEQTKELRLLEPPEAPLIKGKDNVEKTEEKGALLHEVDDEKAAKEEKEDLSFKRRISMTSSSTVTAASTKKAAESAMFIEVGDAEAEKEEKADISFKRRASLLLPSASSPEKPLSVYKRRLSAQLDSITKQINSSSVSVGGGRESVSFLQEVDSAKAKRETVVVPTSSERKGEEASETDGVVEEELEGGRSFQEVDDEEAALEEEEEHMLHNLDHIEIDTHEAQTEKRRRSSSKQGAVEP